MIIPNFLGTARLGDRGVLASVDCYLLTFIHTWKGRKYDSSFFIRLEVLEVMSTLLQDF